MSDSLNESRRLAPDTKWILTALGTGLAIVVAVTQYQLDSLARHFEQRIERTAELTLERANSQRLSRSQMDDAFRSRDRAIKALESEITGLREQRAQTGEALSNINVTLTRIVDVSIQTQARAAQTEGQLKQLLSQTETNANLVGQLVDRHQTTFSNLSERMTRIEATTRAVTPSGTP